MKTPKGSIYISTKDYFKSQEAFDLVLDSSTGILITTPQPAPEDLAGYYESQAYISHSNTQKGIVPFLYRLAQKWSLKNKINLINSLSNHKGTLLDIGAGAGNFCETSKQNSWDVYGVEPSEKAREVAAKKNIFLHQSIEDFTGQQFDVITLWHVLEHLPDLENTITAIQKLLKPKGVLIVAVPNYNSFDAKHYKRFWAAYDVPRHLWHFSQKSMSKLFSKNMKLLKTKPMIFDSFYVSLLSEKYKTGNSFAIKALWIGFLSNISALSTKEYSSLIYCFKKA
ncbi:class I SAM-dependent methyltransferase [Flavobacteriaceae bacterium]|nr:class I SAM-dependent methyltransferase [Flavobacteriaceae bacterium]